MKLKDYYVAQTIEEVVELIKKSKKNIILGGTHWLKLASSSYNMGIDISRLSLNHIEEKELTIEIGGDVSLRQLETNESIQKYAGILSQAVSSIVGVQFRNTARVGASVYSRFAFSDVTTALLAMNTLVEINGKVRIPLESYLTLPRQRHFVTKIIINKEKMTFAYHTMRQNNTSLPYLILAITCSHQGMWRVSVGARPSKAILAYEAMKYLNEGGTDLDEVCALMMDEVGMSDNVFASQAYREHLANVFLKRGVLALWN